MSRKKRKVTGAAKIGLDQLNTMTPAAFVAALGGVFEHSPWVAGTVCASRPFSTVAALHEAMESVVRSASSSTRLDLLRAHPELAGRVARDGRLTPHSSDEQRGVGLDRLTEAESRRFDELNGAYREKFGFPFIIAAKEHTKAGILRAFEARLENPLEVELENASTEVFKITRLRIRDIAEECSGAAK